MTVRKDGSYSAIRDMLAVYWRCYGGARALFASPYLHLALVVTILFFPAWWSREWWPNVLQVLPNIVGFSIGGYAIWLGFGDEKFKALIAQRDSDSDVSPYMEVSATFCHFVVVQLLAILFALGAAAFNVDGSEVALLNRFASWAGVTWPEIADVLRPIGGGIGFLLFTYSLTTAMAAVFAIFEVAQWFDSYRAITAAISGKSNRSVPPPAELPQVGRGDITGSPSDSGGEASGIGRGV